MARVGQDSQIDDWITTEEHGIGNGADSERVWPARCREPSDRHRRDDLSVAHPVVSESQGLGCHVCRGTNEVGAGQDVNTGFGSQWEESSDSIQTLAEESPPARTLAELSECGLTPCDRRHPHAMTLRQIHDVVLLEKQPVLYGVDTGGDGHGRNLTGHGVDCDPGSGLLGDGHGAGQLGLAEVRHRSHTFARPVTNHLHPSSTGFGLFMNGSSETGGVDLTGEAGEVALLRGDEPGRGLDLGTIRLGGLVDEPDGHVVGPTLVEDQGDPGSERLPCSSDSPVETACLVVELGSSEVSVGVDQTGQRPHPLADRAPGIAGRLDPTTVRDVTDHRLAERRPEKETKTHESDGNCRLIHIMTSMWLLFLAVLVTLAACASPPAAGNPTDITPDVTRSSSQPAPTTTETQLEVDVQDCQSPPVTFSPLCEAYELLETWYMDAPIDPEALAAVAVRGLEEFTTDETEAAPRTLFCAIPDPAFSGLCDELAHQVRESSVPVGPAIEAALAHMVDFGLDPFTYYLPPEQAGSVRLNGIVGGIGVVLDARDAAGSKCARVSETCPLEVVIVLEDNPADDAGLQPGDVITAVDGVTVIGQGFTAIVALIAGDENGSIDLVIDRQGQQIEMEMERRELEVPTVEAGIAADGVGYIKIPDFEMDIPGLVADSLEELAAEDPETIVVDLRDNPGGYVDALVEVADLFVDGGIVMTSEAVGEYLEYEATEGGLATSERLVVLVNKGTASAAEILAGALRDRRGAVLVGTDTFGKDTVQIPFELRNGGELYVAVARWSTPNGDTVVNGGLAPDHELSWPAGVEAPEIVDIALEAVS